MRTFTTFWLAVLFLGFTSLSYAETVGKTAYMAKCKVCHAENGTGSPAVEKMLKIDPSLLDLTSSKNKKKTDAEMTMVIRDGQGKMKGMPKDKITDDDLKAIQVNGQWQFLHKDNTPY